MITLKTIFLKNGYTLKIYDYEKNRMKITFIGKDYDDI